jgi:tetratricopeptide (TPR) repeat protein
MARHTGCYFAQVVLIGLTGLSAARADSAADLFRQGHSLRTEGRLREAEQIFRQALAAPGDDRLTIALATSGLGFVLLDLGENQAAGPLLMQALPVLSQELGDASIHTASCRFQLGVYFQGVGRHAQAEDMLSGAKPHLEKALSTDDPQRAAIDMAFGVLYRQTGRYAESGRCLRRAVAIRASKLGKDHWLTGLSCAQLGLTYQWMGRYGEGIREMRRAVAILEATSHQGDLAAALIALGQMNFLAREFQDAERHWKRALTLADTLPNAKESRVAVRASLATLYVTVNRANEAEPLLRDAWATADRDPALAGRRAEILNALGSMYLVRKDLRNADAALERALLLSDESERAFSNILRNRSRTHMAAGRCIEALTGFQRALHLDLERSGESYPHIPDYLFELAEAMRRCGQKTEAKSVRARAEGLAAERGSAFGQHTVDYRDLQREKR